MRSQQYAEIEERLRLGDIAAEQIKQKQYEMNRKYFFDKKLNRLQNDPRFNETLLRNQRRGMETNYLAVDDLGVDGGGKTRKRNIRRRGNRRRSTRQRHL